MVRVQEHTTVRELTHFVGGKHTPGTSGSYGDVYDPNTGEVQARVPLASRAETEATIADATLAQRDWGEWNPPRRARGLLRFLQLDGRDFVLPGHENGFFADASLFDRVTPAMRIHQEEIFGPVLCVVRAADYEEALRLPSEHVYGNGVAIFTRDGDTARDFTRRVNTGMVGVNVPIPVPVAYHTFGGWKRSGFGDLNQHGPDAIRFYTRTKTVTSRWPAAGLREGAGFTIPTMG
ncbi:aldehyde dehydrogenase family protein [Streptomyces avermitilis]|uniref:aldehyde dehydrogenase family protein n=1 Tax=Streptomyces avermitilis TaxID=33903 RepID=UPI00382B3384